MASPDLQTAVTATTAAGTALQQASTAVQAALATFSANPDEVSDEDIESAAHLLAAVAIGDKRARAL
ncbi:MAG: hypothetical protein LBB54_04675, partial [Cellulomonadaceae bacterium]|nr:hypothetical protein [Cellulomonadaceae bacterium]